jgi:hypothetical protein
VGARHVAPPRTRNNISISNKTQDDLRAAYHFDNLQSFLDICCTGLCVLGTDRDFGVDFGEVKDGVLSASTEASSALGLGEKSRRRRLLLFYGRALRDLMNHWLQINADGGEGRKLWAHSILGNKTTPMTGGDKKHIDEKENYAG